MKNSESNESYLLQFYKMKALFYLIKLYQLPLTIYKHTGAHAKLGIYELYCINYLSINKNV